MSKLPKAFAKLDFTKDDFERWVDENHAIKVTDEQWNKVVEVMDNQVSGFLDDLIYETVVDFREGEFN